MSTTLDHVWRIHRADAMCAVKEAQAQDQLVKRGRGTENRSRLEQATAAYFARLSRAAAQKDKSWGLPLGNRRTSSALTVVLDLAM